MSTTIFIDELERNVRKRMGTDKITIDQADRMKSIIRDEYLKFGDDCKTEFQKLLRKTLLDKELMDMLNDS